MSGEIPPQELGVSPEYKEVNEFFRRLEAALDKLEANANVKQSSQS